MEKKLKKPSEIKHAAPVVKVESAPPNVSDVSIPLDQKLKLAELILKGKSRREALRLCDIPLAAVPGLEGNPTRQEISKAMKESGVTVAEVIAKHKEIRDTALSSEKGFSSAVKANKDLGKMLGVFEERKSGQERPIIVDAIKDLEDTINRVTAREVPVKVVGG